MFWILVFLRIMIEPITYLYYSCYKLYSRFNKENPAFQYGALFGVIVFINTTAIVTFVNNGFPSNVVYLIIIYLSIVLSWTVSNFEDKIVNKYDSMNQHKKMIGNIIFFAEIIITILSIILLIRI